MYPIVIIWNSKKILDWTENYYGCVTDLSEIFDIFLSEIKLILNKFDKTIFNNYEEFTWSNFCTMIEGNSNKLEWQIIYFDYNDEFKDYQLDQEKLEVEFNKFVNSWKKL